jgi:hypothetical protein
VWLWPQPVSLPCRPGIRSKTNCCRSAFGQKPSSANVCSRASTSTPVPAGYGTTMQSGSERIVLTNRRNNTLACWALFDLARRCHWAGHAAASFRCCVKQRARNETTLALLALPVRITTGARVAMLETGRARGAANARRTGVGRATTRGRRLLA